MTQMKLRCAPWVAILTGLAGLSAARAGEPRIKYVYQLGVSSDDGANPGNLLEWIDGSLYGAAGATNSSCGSIFRIVDGVGTTLGKWDCSKGSLNPAGFTAGDDGNLYGTATGLAQRFSTLFRLNPDGVATSIVRIPYADGLYFSQLVPFGDRSFFVSAMGGGDGKYCQNPVGCGTVFRITLPGEVDLVETFDGGIVDPVNPNGLVLAKDGYFYGASRTEGLGSFGYYGTVFQVDPNGGVRIIYEFSDQNSPETPSGPLTLGKDGSLYGVGEFGGNAEGSNDQGDGGVFQLDVNGNRKMYVDFDGYNGRYPMGNLVLANDGNLYGTTFQGGGISRGFGTIFRMTPTGALSAVYTFTGEPTDAEYPQFGMIQASDGKLYGTANGGLHGQGVVFQLDLGLKPRPPELRNFEPASGPVGTVVSIRGDRFVRVSGVRFGVGTMSTPMVISPGAMTVTVPEGAVSGPLTISAAAGSGQSAGTFTVTR